MHIEIGIISPEKLAYAGVAATALLGAHTMGLLKSPTAWLRTALAAFFFSLLMQAWHLPVGPSELHLVGAMPVYLLFGFIPTLFGFGLGLLVQAMVFEPQDMAHLAVNFLSLAVPLDTVAFLPSSPRNLCFSTTRALRSVCAASRAAASLTEGVPM